MSDPINLIDPSGNCPWCIGAALGGISAGATAYLAGGSARDVAVAAGIGAVAGAASMGISAFTTTATGIISANAIVGGVANIATQFANGRSFGQIDAGAVGIGALAGGIGGAAGLAAGNMAFFGTPTIGNPISMALARGREAWASAITGAAVGTGIESGANVCR